jgi:hypothetical protein
MARREIHSTTLPKIEQRAPLKPNVNEHVGDVITGETIRSVDATYLSDLAMNEEPVTIQLEPSSDKNAAGAMPVWVNGKGAEVLINGRWVEIIYLPVGVPLTIKRKYLGIIICAKTDAVHTKVQDMDSERPNNVVQRFTSPVMAFSILEDTNPRGAAWCAELRRRNL